MKKELYGSWDFMMKKKKYFKYIIMAILNFQKQFVPLIESGEKRQTIRKARKHPIKVGETLYLYAGLRTKYVRKIGEYKCKFIDKIKIEVLGGIWINGRRTIYYLDYLDSFAKSDGFKNWREMIQWFEKYHGLSFEGILIKW